jgi:4-hydroxy-2-oxoglutarate aldolase
LLRGIFAPIPTPFRDDEIDFAALRSNLDRWARTDLAGLVVLGSNGEFVLLSDGEKERLLEFVRANFPADRPLLAGTGCESTRDTIRLTRRAAALGSTAALVVTPSYYKGSMTDPALKRFFLDVADASTIPVMLYNMPRNTGINMSTALIIECAKHPNIVGIKDSGGNIVQIAEVIAGTGPDFAVFAGSGSFLYATAVLGGVGGTLAVANILPDMCAAIQRLAEEGRHEEARRRQLKILAANAAVTTKWGVPGLKAAMDILGWAGGPPRPPLLPIGEPSLSELRKILSEVTNATEAMGGEIK